MTWIQVDKNTLTSYVYSSQATVSSFVSNVSSEFLKRCKEFQCFDAVGWAAGRAAGL